MTISVYKLKKLKCLLYYCCCSVTQSCLTLCDDMDCSTTGFSALHHLPKLAQTHVHWVGPTISSFVVSFFSCLQSFPASRSFPRSQFFASGGQSIGVSASTSVLSMNSGMISLGLTSLILQSKGLSRVFPNITVQKHQFFDAQLSLWSNSIWLLEKLQLWLCRPLSAKCGLCFLTHCLGLSWFVFQGASVF